MQKDQEIVSLLMEEIQKSCFSFGEGYCMEAQVTPK